MTREYTAEDGLKILTYLGITDLKDNEIRVFREDWNEIYEKNNNLLTKELEEKLKQKSLDEILTGEKN